MNIPTRTAIAVIALLLAPAAPGLAQTTAPASGPVSESTVDLFVGYSFGSVNHSPVRGLQGGVAVALPTPMPLRVVAQVSHAGDSAEDLFAGYAFSRSLAFTSIQGGVTRLFAVTPTIGISAQALAGVTRESASANGVSASSWKPSIEPGVGVDLKLTGGTYFRGMVSMLLMESSQENFDFLGRYFYLGLRHSL